MDAEDILIILVGLSNARSSFDITHLATVQEISHTFVNTHL